MPTEEKKVRTEADELPSLLIKLEKLEQAKKEETERFNEEIRAYKERIREIAHSADQTLMNFDAEDIAG